MGCYLAPPTPAARPARPHILQELFTVKMLKGSHEPYDLSYPCLLRGLRDAASVYGVPIWYLLLGSATQLSLSDRRQRKLFAAELDV